MLSDNSSSARKLAQMLGKLNAATRAIPLAQLFYMNLQRALACALGKSGQDYSLLLRFSEDEREELQWWIDHLSSWNGKTMLSRKPTLTIESDASRTGWGATCKEVRTGGPWSEEEQRWHINCLETQAAFLAVKCFAKDRNSISILLRLDNTIAVSYINNLGGTVSPQLTELVKQLWLQRDITLEAEHLPGALNTIADEESRVMKDHSDWKLNPRVFMTIQETWGPLTVDLFASRLTHQLNRYFSWRPDPEAEAWNAFSQDWGKIQGRLYANPPWSLVSSVLTQAQAQGVSMILVAPIWKMQPWYLSLLSMLTDYPVRLPSRKDLILLTHPCNKPEVEPQLAVWPISGIGSKVNKFLRRVQNSSLPHGDRNPLKLVMLMALTRPTRAADL